MQNARPRSVPNPQRRSPVDRAAAWARFGFGAVEVALAGVILAGVFLRMSIHLPAVFPPGH